MKGLNASFTPTPKAPIPPCVTKCWCVCPNSKEIDLPTLKVAIKLVSKVMLILYSLFQKHCTIAIANKTQER